MRFQGLDELCTVWTGLYDNHDIYFYLLNLVDIELARSRESNSYHAKGGPVLFLENQLSNVNCNICIVNLCLN